MGFEDLQLAIRFIIIYLLLIKLIDPKSWFKDSSLNNYHIIMVLEKTIGFLGYDLLFYLLSITRKSKESI